MIMLALIGYGKMGKTVERLALESGHIISAKIDPAEPGLLREITADTLNGAEVCVDFSHPIAALDNIRAVARLGKNMVVGTTGWYQDIDEVSRIIKDAHTGLIWSGNFSIGVQAFLRIIETAGRVMNGLPQYDALIHEYHHRHKADAPSGTALMVADRLLATLDRKTERAMHDGREGPLPAHVLELSSARGGEIPGIHTALFDSKEDTIELTHSARNRDGFASGALLAAEFIQNKQGMYTIDDLMNYLLS